MNFNKKLLFTAFVALQSIAYASDIRGTRFLLGGNPSTYTPTSSASESTIATVLANRASDHADHAQTVADHAQTVADEASDHAVVSHALVSHLNAKREAEDAKYARLAHSLAVIKRYNNQPNPKNGTLKPGYVEWKKAVQYVKTHAREYISYAQEAILQAATVLEVLPELTLEAKTANAELRMAINALEGALKNI